MKDELMKKPNLQEMIVASTKELGNALPSHMTPERLVRIALTCIRLNPKLAKCTPESFLGALFTSAQLGLEPVAGRAYLIPFANNRKINGQWVQLLEVQFIIGYQGMIDLFYRNERALTIQAHTVCKNDFFEYVLGTESKLVHRPAVGERGEATFYYALAKMVNGGSMFVVMSKNEINKHAEHYSKQFDHKENKWGDKAVWMNEFDEMAKKTVIKRLAKSLPLSIELQRAIQQDETSREFKTGVASALDLPNTSFEEMEEEDDGEKSNRAKKEQALIDEGKSKKDEKEEKSERKALAERNKKIIDDAVETWIVAKGLSKVEGKSEAMNKIHIWCSEKIGKVVKDYADLLPTQAAEIADMFIEELK